jgi:fatty-acid desaturase
VKTPAWLRVLQISIGVISIILSGYVLLYPGITVLVAVQILSIVLLIVGIERIAIGIFSPYHRKSSSRFSNIGRNMRKVAMICLNISQQLSGAVTLERKDRNYLGKL